MKHIIVLIFLTSRIFSQSSNLDMQLFEVKIMKDTLSQQNNYNLFVEINIQNIQAAKSITLSILSQSGSLVEEIGSFDFKKHSAGFYYIESLDHQKITVMSNKISYMKLINSSIYNNSYIIKLDYKSTQELVKSITKSISR